ncbi:MAG: FHA domain-containing protein [Actinobacteria bacterium]|nr:FHA domain-containing protein [Actinomycetota bacterium]
MSTSLIWADSGVPRVIPIDRGAGAIIIGRSPDSVIQFADDSVSRHHALLRIGANGDSLDNLSKSNPARVNERPIDQPARLSDGDLLTFGKVTVAYHNLSQAARISGPRCAHCGRENATPRKDCWFCGTSLVNAGSADRTRVPIAFRAARVPGKPWVDVAPGEMLAIRDGNLLVEPEAMPKAGSWTVSTGDGHLRLNAGDEPPELLLNEEMAREGPITAGDQLTVDADRVVLLTRE